MRDSFTIYRNTLEALESLPPDTAIQIMSCIGRYSMDDTLPNKDSTDPIVYAFFTQIKALIDTNKARAENGKKGGRPKTKFLTEEEKEEETKARQSTEYKAWRDAVYKRDNYTCQGCGSTENLNAHHIKSFTDAPDLRFVVDNGITLCSKCHAKAHSQKPSEKLNKANEPTEKAKEPINKKEETGKEKEEKRNNKESVKRFTPPTLTEVQEYVKEQGYNIDTQRFIDYYASKGWVVGKSPMKDWKAAVRNWSRSQRQETTAKDRQEKTALISREYDYEALERELLRKQGGA